MPTKTTRSPGARTSGTELGGFGFRDEPFVKPFLEGPPQIFARHRGNAAWTTGLDLHGVDRRVVVAVATGVALGFRERPEAPHGSSAYGPVRTAISRLWRPRGRRSSGMRSTCRTSCGPRTG